MRLRLIDFCQLTLYFGQDFNDRVHQIASDGKRKPYLYGLSYKWIFIGVQIWKKEDL